MERLVLTTHHPGRIVGTGMLLHRWIASRLRHRMLISTGALCVLVALSAGLMVPALSQHGSSSIASADTSFPFAVGNSWYYQKTGTPASEVGRVKTIIGTLLPPNVGFVVRVRSVYADSIQQWTEYWSWDAGKLKYSSDSSSWPVQPVYNEQLTHDTSWAPTSGVTAGYTMLSVTRCGIQTSGQRYWSNASRSGYSSSDWESAALHIGFLDSHHEAWLNGSQMFSYELHLLGMTIGGVVYGDTTLVSSVGDEVARPGVVALYQNYPNPFNPVTRIGYSVGVIGGQWSVAARVRLAVYDLLGREVAVLVNETKDAGAYTVAFDGSGLAGGMYICRMTVGDQMQARKMTLVR